MTSAARRSRDSAAVSGRVAPLDGATIDFRLYGPDDVRCAGPPVFESLGVPYPAGRRARRRRRRSPPPQPGRTAGSRAYSGDANNLPVSGACGAAGESVLVDAGAAGDATRPSRRVRPRGTAGYCFGRRATIVAAPGQKVITGTPGADVIIGGPAGETIDGRGGNDLICAGRGNDTVSGGTGNDKLRGEAGNDQLFGDSGADLLLGSGGADDLRAGSRQRSRGRRRRHRPYRRRARATTSSTSRSSAAAGATGSSAAPAATASAPPAARPTSSTAASAATASCATRATASGAASGSRGARTRRSLPVARRRSLAADCSLPAVARAGAGGGFPRCGRASRLCWR